jgi:hypothetical protein
MHVELLNYLRSEINNAKIKLSIKENGREGVDFLIVENQLYL